MRPTRDETMMEVAEVFARRSTCLRRGVGCVLADARGHVLAIGHNGVAADQPHCNDEGAIKTFPHACPGAFAKSGVDLDGCHAIHAEQNALLQCRDPFAIDSCYCTTAPCVSCTKLLLNTSCRRIIYRDGYPQADAARSLFTGRSGRVFRALLRHPRDVAAPGRG